MPSLSRACLDICIVSWRSRDLLRACLRSVAAQPEVAEIVVVDNASADGTVEMVRAEFPAVRLIANESNLGFAAGNNQAIRETHSPFVLLLNPDTEVHRDALRAMLDVFAEEERIGAVAAQLILPDGTIQRSCRSFPEPIPIVADALGLARLFPNSKTLGAYRMRSWDHSSRREADQPMASALALRRAALDEIGLFDEEFPLYFNDVDLCFRLKQAGWRIIFEPKAGVTHHYGESSTWQVRPSGILESHWGLIRFYRKHYAGRVCPCEYGLVVAGAWITMWPRAAIARLRGR